MSEASIAFVDRPGPSIWEALVGDPTHHFDERALSLHQRDSTRWSARWIKLPVQALSLLVVAIVTIIKRALPFEVSSHNALDRLGIWFLSRCVSSEGEELLLRHFVLETNALAFIARNAGLPEPTLRPQELDGLRGNAVIVHDLNVYEVLHGLGNRPIERPEVVDFSMLVEPDIQTTTAKKLMRLDLGTGLACMNVAFVLLTTTGEYQRAVHSLQLDESLMRLLAAITGDPAFIHLSPPGYLPIVRTGRNVPRELYAHAVIHEYANARLLFHAKRSSAVALTCFSHPTDQ